eukprot:TRINITY_DN60981_c0_g1_i1.p1 TRINITY_DN60981_c0_g1~~TRINITY_DN60981_c0_g1_i1.p1  ORF type:complete len:377 (+),score=50.87 TRINITY_DN60981_c0_g1_i1:109-1131(+)
MKLPCWEIDSSHQSLCCRQRHDRSCFDGIFTKAECCSSGEAVVFPEAELAPPPPWLPGDDSVQHPAFSEEQRAWEASHASGSILHEFTFHGIHLRLHEFKDGRQSFTNYKSYMHGGKDTYALASHRLPAGAIAADVGANLGLVSILLARFGHPTSFVFALELHPVLFRYLLWNLRENNVTARVWPLNLGGCDPTMAIRGVPFAAWWAPHEAKAIVGHLDRSVLQNLRTVFLAPCVSFAQLLDVLGLDKLDFLKLDCEGCEWGFLGTNGSWKVAAARISRFVGELGHPTLATATSGEVGQLYYNATCGRPTGEDAKRFVKAFCLRVDGTRDPAVEGCERIT